MPKGKVVLDQDANDPAEETADEQTEKTSEDDSSEETEVSDESNGAEAEGEPEAKPAPKDEKPSERPVWTMPVSKAQEEKARAVEKAKEEAKKEAVAEMQKLRDEYEAKLQQASQSSRADNQYVAELEKVAKEYGLEPKAATALLEVFKKAVPLPDMSKYDQIVKEKEIEAHKTAVSKDFDERVAPLILKDFPQATPEHIRQVKERVGELAFSEGYNTYRLEDIYKINRDEFAFKNSISAESSGGRSSDLSAFKVLSDEEEIKLADKDPKAYGKYLKWLETQETSYLENS